MQRFRRTSADPQLRLRRGLADPSHEMAAPGRETEKCRPVRELLGGCRSELHALDRYVVAYQQHPWTLQVFIRGPPLGAPNQMQFLEAGLQPWKGLVSTIKSNSTWSSQFPLSCADQLTSQLALP